MTDPTTTNKILAQPTRGSDSGTWDTPVNGNMGIIDASFGGVTALTLSNSNVALSTAQAQNAFLVLSGTLSANVTITFPGGIGSFFFVQHNALTTTSSFVVSLVSTASGSVTIGLPPGEFSHVGLNGTTGPALMSLPHVGTYWQFGGSAVPAWVSACTTPPWLNCTGGTFSSATYPQLATYLNGNTLPDTRGSAFFTLDQGTGRNSGTFLAQGGNANMTLSAANLPAHNHPVSDPGHIHTWTGWTTGQVNANGGGNAGAGGSNPAQVNNTSNATTGLTVSNSTYANTSFSILPPGYIGGITMIRAG